MFLKLSQISQENTLLESLINNVLVFRLAILLKRYRNSHQRFSMKRALLKNLEHSQENTCVGVAFCLSYRPLGLQLSQKKTQARLFFCEQFKIFKSTYFEEHLQKTASICFTSKYYSGGEFGLGETSTECILFNQMQLYNLYISYNKFL